MSVERSNVEILCDNCLEPKDGGVEWEGMVLCVQCFRDEVLPIYDDELDEDDN